MPCKTLILLGLLAFSVNLQAQDLNKNTSAADLELIELLGSLDNFADGSGDTSAMDLDALDDAMLAAETKNMTKKPTLKTQDVILKDKTHPVGGEK
jgi:hypothetical protein